MTITTELRAYYDPAHFGPTVCGVPVRVWNEVVGLRLAEIDAAAASARKMARAEEWARQTARGNGTTDLSTIQAVGDRAYSEELHRMVEKFAEEG